MKNLSEIKNVLRHAEAHTVINDGDVRYAVLTESLDQWESEYGDISGENYDAFCDSVPYVLTQLGTPGNRFQVELCDRLLNRGSDSRRF